jgi:hypothetical protein
MMAQKGGQVGGVRFKSRQAGRQRGQVLAGEV